MQLIHVAAASLNQTPLAWDANKENILRSITMAKKQGVSILCLPEMCITGYGCEDAFQAPGLLHTAEEILQEITPHTQGIIVAIGCFHHGHFPAVSSCQHSAVRSHFVTLRISRVL